MPPCLLHPCLPLQPAYTALFCAHLAACLSPLTTHCCGCCATFTHATCLPCVLLVIPARVHAFCACILRVPVRARACTALLPPLPSYAAVLAPAVLPGRVWFWLGLLTGARCACPRPDWLLSLLRVIVLLACMGLFLFVRLLLRAHNARGFGQRSTRRRWRFVHWRV